MSFNEIYNDQEIDYQNNRNRILSSQFYCQNPECLDIWHKQGPPPPPRLKRQRGGFFVVREILPVTCANCQSITHIPMLVLDGERYNQESILHTNTTTPLTDG